MQWWMLWLVELLWVAGVGIWVATDRRAPASTLAWIVVLAFLPLIGLPVYLLVGPRRLRRQRLRYQGLSESVSAALGTVERHPDIPPDIARQVRLAARLDEAPLSSATSLTHYGSGAEAFAAIERDIAAARHHVHLEFYIWNDDCTGQRIRDLLTERARAGIEVRVLVDSVGAGVNAAFFSELVAAGGHYARFNPPRFGLRLRLLNFRSHRKIVVVDGEVGYLGGMNVCDEQTSGLKGKSPWRDTQLRMEGEAVRWLQRSFLENWQFSTPLGDRARALSQPTARRPLAQIVRGGPIYGLPDPRVLHRHRRRRRAYLDHLPLPRSRRGHFGILRPPIVASTSGCWCRSAATPGSSPRPCALTTTIGSLAGRGCSSTARRCCMPRRWWSIASSRWSAARTSTIGAFA
jgi:phosphatidylserine/phosphatidylglycerophosphate/cardiolipin synthase-like enzyme